MLRGFGPNQTGWRRFVGSILLQTFFGGGYADDIFKLIIMIEDKMLIFIINILQNGEMFLPAKYFVTISL